MSEQIVHIAASRHKQQCPATRERELQLKNENLQRYVTQLLTRNAALSARVRELEGARR